MLAASKRQRQHNACRFEAAGYFGLMMAGTPLPGARYQQEVAPKVAMDRAEIVSLTETLHTPAGKFEKCLKTKETSALERGTEHKLYAPSIGHHL